MLYVQYDDHARRKKGIQNAAAAKQVVAIVVEHA
jgi:hypothetical protein